MSSNEHLEHKCIDLRAYDSSQHTGLFALLSKFLNFAYLSSYQQTLLKQQILHRKTARSLYMLYTPSSKQQKLKCLLISIKTDVLA